MFKLISVSILLFSISSFSAEISKKTPAKRSIASADSFSCSGTEPFWNMQIENGKKMSGTVDGLDAKSRVITSAQPSAGSNTGMAYSSKSKSGQVEIALVESVKCSDGMSEINYDYTISFLTVSRDGISGYMSGCCNKK